MIEIMILSNICPDNSNMIRWLNLMCAKMLGIFGKISMSKEVGVEASPFGFTGG